MRLLSLTKLAAEAEGLRLKLLAKRQARRAIWAAVAVVFALFLAVMLHLTAYEFLMRAVAPPYAALIVTGVDLLALAIFGVMASRSSPGVQELEAAAISRSARRQLTDAATTFSIMAPVRRVTGIGGWKAALASNVVAEMIRKRRR